MFMVVWWMKFWREPKWQVQIESPLGTDCAGDVYA